MHALRRLSIHATYTKGYVKGADEDVVRKTRKYSKCGDLKEIGISALQTNRIVQLLQFKLGDS